mmetsp:Transcript_81170/g.173712  ORF Transcript_81170/g.173712 Transcript_81170/m.173712 type:complete len:148 (+) Transcript_81170:2656-3099(+)
MSPLLSFLERLRTPQPLPSTPQSADECRSSRSPVLLVPAPAGGGEEQPGCVPQPPVPLAQAPLCRLGQDFVNAAGAPRRVLPAPKRRLEDRARAAFDAEVQVSLPAAAAVPPPAPEARVICTACRAGPSAGSGPYAGPSRSRDLDPT